MVHNLLMQFFTLRSSTMEVFRCCSYDIVITQNDHPKYVKHVLACIYTIFNLWMAPKRGADGKLGPEHGVRLLGDASPPAPGVPDTSRRPPEERAASKPADAASVAAERASAAAILVAPRRWAAAARRWRRLAAAGTIGDAEIVAIVGGREGQRPSPSSPEESGRS